MSLDPSLIAFVWAAIAATVIGVAKAGFGGVGTIVAVPIMALGAEPAFVLGVLLPILMLADVISVTGHRHDFDRRAVLQAVPGALLGVLLGAALLASVNGTVMMLAIGVLSIVFAVDSFARARGAGGNSVAFLGSPRLAPVFGAAAGLTSTLAHAGGPPIHMHLLARGYAPVVFVATASVFMASMNLMKVLPYLLVGTVNRTTLLYSLGLVPFVVAAAFGGIWLARRIPRQRFAVVVNTLMLVVGVKLVFDGVTGLIA